VFRDRSVAVQGLGTLERLLFNTGLETLKQGDKASYRCRLAEAIADNLRRMAIGALDNWRGGKIHYRQVVATAADGNANFDSAREVTARLLNNLHTQLQAIEQIKLGRVLDDKRRNPKRAESWRARRSLKNIEVNLESAQKLYRTAFAPLIAEPAVRQSLELAFAEALQQTRGIEPSLYQAAATPEGLQQLEALRRQVAELRMQVAGRIPAAIGIPLGFNSLDGD